MRRLAVDQASELGNRDAYTDVFKVARELGDGADITLQHHEANAKLNGAFLQWFFCLNHALYYNQLQFNNKLLHIMQKFCVKGLLNSFVRDIIGFSGAGNLLAGRAVS